ELVATPPDRVVRLTNLRPEERSDHPEDGVAAVVPKGVVEPLEVVDVQKDYREWREIPAMPFDLPPLDFIEEPPVVATSQWIGNREPLDFLVCPGKLAIGQP